MHSEEEKKTFIQNYIYCRYRNPEEFGLERRKYMQTYYPGMQEDILQQVRTVFDIKDVPAAQEKLHFENFCYLLKNHIPQYGISAETFSLSNISKELGKMKIDVSEQSPLPSGFFTKKNTSLEQIKTIFSVKEYVEYQEENINENIETIAERESNVFFGINLDIGEWREGNQEFYKLPDWMRFLSKDDIQGCLRNDVLGMTTPQIYLKVPGCWTGGHQENLRLRAVNLNHGPGDVEWYCMEIGESDKLRELILKERSFDIYQKEHRWYLDLDSCIKYGLKFSKFIQEPGDIVILAPGTLHWVRSYSVTVNSAWNLGYLDYTQIKEIICRWKINREIGFENLIPVKTLIFDIINNWFHLVKEESARALLLENLQETIIEDIEERKLIEEKYPNAKVVLHDPEFANVTRCEECDIHRETFNYWGFYEPKKLKRGQRTMNFICLMCIPTFLTTHNIPITSLTI